MKKYWLLIFSFFIFGSTLAQNAIDTIKCDADTLQSYCVYVPSQYSKVPKLPVIFLFDPAARGRLPVVLFKPIAEELGIIVIASNNSRNGPFNLSLQAADAMFTDAFKKYHINESEIYLGGFSGGARVAISIAQNSPTIAGVIACSAGFSNIPEKKLPWYFTGIAGLQDFNYIEMQQAHLTLDSLQTDNNLIFFNGPHRWPPEGIIKQAMLSQYQHRHNITGQKQEVSIDKQLYRKELTFQNEAITALEALVFDRAENVKPIGWWRSKQAGLKKALITGIKADSDYVARQISFISINATAEFESCYQAKRYEAAEEVLKIATVFDAAEPMIAYRYARLSAIQKDQDATLNYLEEAIKKGLKDKKMIQNERLFSFLKENKRFKAMVNY
ncbi:hypothetical protein KXQ82_15720 [Mucilaginibacter sp. HMF5004]|uniref:TPR end-of-group domain-containing protein n=1 Tax=Mucilaginibacter rivuli TaxID=2857527 RepID=UPI001C5D8C24|nr:hypothetical protein [Mucilaginibacter rivuli]MBW4891174.1 hypothetical protein [Mucilaginibacter rivuli]